MSISGAVNSKKVDLSSIRKEQGAQDGQQGRLPGTIRPQNAKDLAFLDLQANPFQGLFSPLSPPPRPISLVDAFCFDREHHTTKKFGVIWFGVRRLLFLLR